MSQSDAWCKFLFSQALHDNDDFTLGLLNWRAERVKQLAAIYQIKDLSKLSVGRPKMIKDN